MDRAKAIEKIKKCLRLSRSNNSNEAATALRQAQALMSEHGVELEDVEASEIREVAAPDGSSAQWEVMLSGMVKGCFSCDCILAHPWDASAWRFKSEWRFIGKGANPEIAAYAFDVLRRQIRLSRTQYIVTALRRCQPASKRRRADAFCRGWVSAAREKAVNLVPSEQDARAIQLFLENKYPNSKETAGRKSGRTDYRDLVNGLDEGAKAQLHRGVDRADLPQLTRSVG